MRRILFNATTLISTFLFVAVLAVWVVSYVWTVFLPLPTSLDDGMLLAWGRGRLSVGWIQNHQRGQMPPIEVRRPAHRIGKEGFGFLVYWRTPTATSSFGNYVVRFPIWFFALICVIVPGVWLFRRRQPRGHCANCGYDLRASVGMCPECGRSIPSGA